MEKQNLFSKLLLTIMSISLFINTPLMCMNPGQTQSKKQENQACCICCEEFKDEDEVTDLGCLGAKTSEKKHIYHPNCIGKWFENHDDCPICREEATIDKSKRKKYKDYRKEKIKTIPITNDINNLQKDILNAVRIGKNGKTKQNLLSRIKNLKNRVEQELGKNHSEFNRLNNLEKNLNQIKDTKSQPQSKCNICGHKIENLEESQSSEIGTVHKICYKDQIELEDQKRIVSCSICKNQIINEDNRRRLMCGCNFHKNCLILKDDNCPHCKHRVLFTKSVKKKKSKGNNICVHPKPKSSKKSKPKKTKKKTSFPNFKPSSSSVNMPPKKIKKTDTVKKKDGPTTNNPTNNPKKPNNPKQPNRSNAGFFKRLIAPTALLGAAIATWFVIKKIFKPKKVVKRARWWSPCWWLGLLVK